MAEFEDFELGLDAPFLGAARPCAAGGGVEIRCVAIAEIERAAIELNRSPGMQLCDMDSRSSARSCRCRARAARDLRSGTQIAAHPGGQVDDHIGVAVAHPIDHFLEQLWIARRLPVSGSRTWIWATAAPALAASIAASAICFGRTGTCGLRPSCPAPGDGTGDDDFVVHAEISRFDQNILRCVGADIIEISPFETEGDDYRINLRIFAVHSTDDCRKNP